MVESRSVRRNAKNARGLGRDSHRPLFPSHARLNFTFNKFPLRMLSESLAQAMIKRTINYTKWRQEKTKLLTAAV